MKRSAFLLCLSVIHSSSFDVVVGHVHMSRLHALVLRPTGDGSSDHLEASVELPGELPLAEGLQEIGREPPADAVCAVPTVSTRHAMIRVGAAQDLYLIPIITSASLLCNTMLKLMSAPAWNLRTQMSQAAVCAEGGKDVYITDLNSTNGTFVRLPQAEEAQELEPMEWSPLPVGSQVVFGARRPNSRRTMMRCMRCNCIRVRRRSRQVAHTLTCQPMGHLSRPNPAQPYFTPIS